MGIELENISTDSNWGVEAPKINTNNQKLVTEIIKAQNGEGLIKYYNTSADLNTLRPNPSNGEQAWVGTPYPGTVWNVVDGIWTNKTVVPDVNTVDLSGYVKSGGTTSTLKQVENKDQISSLLNWTFTGYIKYDGTLQALNGWQVSDYIELNYLNVYISGWLAEVSIGYNFGFYTDKDISTFISGYSVVGQTANKLAVNIPVGAKYFRFGNSIERGAVTVYRSVLNVFDVIQPQINTINTSITDHEKRLVTANLTSIDTITYGYIGKDGDVVAYNNPWGYSSFLDRVDGTLLYVDNANHSTTSAALGWDIAFYDNDKVFISGINRGIYNFFEVPFPENCVFWRITQNTTALKYIATKVDSLDALKKYLLSVISKLIVWCAIGDSITAGNENNTGTSYATVLAENNPNIQLIKAGYWGHTMKQSLATTAYSRITPQTQIVTINFGSNDIAVLGSSQWGDIDAIMSKTYEQLQDNVSSFESLRLFVEKCRRNYPSLLIYFITPIKRQNNQSQFIAMEKDICQRLSIPCLDANAESGIQFNDAIYTSDGVHPNDAGKLVFARWLGSKINFNILF